MTPDQPQGKRSRKLYTLWATALTLLISTALFCWLVVVPLLQVRAVVREGAIGALTSDGAISRLGGPVRALPKLKLYVQLWGKVDVDVDRYWATGLLGKCGQEGVPFLLKCLSDKSRHVRRSAVDSLGEIVPPDPGVVLALANALRDDDQWVRRNAAAALGRFGPAAVGAVPQLTAALSDPWRDVRYYAAESLGRIGPKAYQARSALEKSRNDSEADVRQAAAEALKKIRGGQEKK